MKIGVFDSGLGGLVIAKSLMDSLPYYDYVYFGDTEHLPYGDKTNLQIKEYTENAIRFLINKNCKIIIIACNTASTVCLRYIQQVFCPNLFPDIKVLGVIIPTIEIALDYQDNKIGVVGTNATIKSGVYNIELKKKKTDIDVISMATPELVPLIESNDFVGAENIIKQYCKKLTDIPVLILGCTHYPLVKHLFERYLPDTKIIAQNDFMGYKLKDYLSRHSEIEINLSRNSSRNFFVSKNNQKYTEIANLLFPDAKIEKIPCFFDFYNIECTQ